MTQSRSYNDSVRGSFFNFKELYDLYTSYLLYIDRTSVRMTLKQEGCFLRHINQFFVTHCTHGLFRTVGPRSLV